MSPASQGGLLVDHYIGSSLISASARVSTRGHGRPRKDPKAVNPIPTDYLLRNGRAAYPVPTMLPSCDATFPYRPANTVGWAGLPLIAVAPHKPGKRPPGPYKAPQQPYQARKSAVDEERTPLSRLAIHTQGAPLIHAVKCNVPRKPQLKNNRDVIVRRNNKYKDGRGPPGPSDNLSVTSDESSGSGQLENILPRIIKPRKRRKKDRKPCPTLIEPLEGSPPPVEVAPRSHVGGAADDPQLHHSFEDVIESDIPCPQLQSSCQCHYCDPSGIWDSPAADLVLRRSWSEPLPGTSRALQRSHSLDVHWESLQGCHISVDEGERVSRPVPRTPCLEVSTEIVTSPNGHRDLEIRFYSSSSPS